MWELKNGVNKMKGYLITTGTVTYALKGRDILRKKGFKANVEKAATEEKNMGCGYQVAVYGDIDSAEQILRNAGVKILKISEMKN